MAALDGYGARMEHHHVIDLQLQPHEASGLVTSRSQVLKDALGMDPLYWTVLDDGQVENCIAVIGQAQGTVEPTAHWSSRRLHCTITTPTGATDDGEAIAEHEGWIYVFGSAYGSKNGPLEPERSFVSRFHENDVRVDDDGELHADLHVRADPFALHQVVNDALRRTGVDVLPPSPKIRKHFVAKARQRAIDEGADWVWRLRHDDVPINIEGAAFRPGGTVVLGLRLPVTGDGHPLLVEVAGIDRLFDPALGDPEAVAVWTAPSIGSRRAPVGIRDLHLQDAALHLLVGNLDSQPDESRLLREHPEGATAVSQHWEANFPEAPPELERQMELDARHVHTFEGLYRVEGIAVDGTHTLYVSDEDDIVRTRLVTSGR